MPKPGSSKLRRLHRGEHVRVRRDATDEWAEAFVALATDGDPASIMLMGEGLVVRVGTSGFILDALPLTIHYAEETARGLTGDEYAIEVMDAAS
jgi:hypothetical protein